MVTNTLGSVDPSTTSLIFQALIFFLRFYRGSTLPVRLPDAAEDSGVPGVWWYHESGQTVLSLSQRPYQINLSSSGTLVDLLRTVHKAEGAGEIPL